MPETKEVVIKDIDINGHVIDEKRKNQIRKDLTARHFTSENARELQLKGVEQRKKNTERRRSMQEIAKWLMNMPVKKRELLDAEAILELESAQAINMTGGEAIMLAQLQRAMAGDTASAQFIRDTAGEKPKEQIEVGGMTIDEYAKSHKPKF